MSDHHPQGATLMRRTITAAALVAALCLAAVAAVVAGKVAVARRPWWRRW